MADASKLLTIFRERFSEFSDVNDKTLMIFIGDAVALSSLSDRAIVYLAAHLYVVDKGAHATVDSGANTVVSERTGKHAVTYAQQSERSADSFYETTKYGRMFLQLKRQSHGFRVRVYE